jgi:hypothetical protein
MSKIRYHFRIEIFVCFVFIILSNCTSKKKDSANETELKKVDTVVAAKLNPDVNLNNFYGILASDSTSINLNSDFDKRKKFLENCTVSNALWNKMYNNLLTPISNWKNSALPDSCLNTNFLFYPFSGPDFLIPNTLFTQTKHIVMFGLELPGKDMSKYGNDFALNSMPLMQKSLRDYFGKSYFITKNMMKDLKSDSLNGVTPLISTFLVKSNFKLISIKNFKLDKAGEKVYFELEKDSFSYANIYGVEINYTKDLINSLQIDYLSFNAEDPSMQNHPEIMQFFERTIPTNTVSYLKSASYLLHYAGFSTIRNLVLNKSIYILQDDTGIAERYFTNDCKLSLWGVYEKPIKDFSGVYQKGLDSLYKVKNQVKPLPFNMGYHYFNGNQNLLLAEKK